MFAIYAIGNILRIADDMEFNEQENYSLRYFFIVCTIISSTYGWALIHFSKYYEIDYNKALCVSDENEVNYPRIVEKTTSSYLLTLVKSF